MTSIYEKLRPVVFQLQPTNQQRSASQSTFGQNCTKVNINSSGEIQNYFMQSKKNISQQYQTTREKENTLDSKQSIKCDEIVFLKQRIKQLEKMNSHYISENNKLNEMIQKYMENEKQNAKSQTEDFVYKMQIQELERKILGLQEDNKLLLQNKEEHNQVELDKYKTKCYLLQNKVKQYQEEKKIVDLQKKGKKLFLENQQLKSTVEYLQSENSNLQKQIIQNGNSITKTKDENIVFELENQNKYMTQILELDKIKMKNLEEKVEILTLENKRLQDIVKGKRA